MKNLKGLSDPMPLIENSILLKSVGDVFRATSIYLLYCVNEMIDHWFQDVWQEGKGISADVACNV